ncbi:MAG: hypothetical protein GPJ51_07785 [Candidatus Heimdallarchaeota archaeon]|nr:hypothetical protein [Candidatus Heimdallarchaeota archaeon]
MTGISDQYICPNCFTEGASVLEKKETFHLDNDKFFQIVHLTLVCKDVCWHNWTEYYRILLKDFSAEEKITVVPYFTDEIISPDQIEFKEK